MKDNAMSGKPSKAGKDYFKKQGSQIKQFYLLYIFKGIPVNTLFMDKAPFTLSKKSILEGRASTLDITLSHTIYMPQQQQ